MSLWDIKRLCVDDFASSSHRKKLFLQLEEFVQRFLREDIPCEVWVDGSYMTKKPEPEDIDVAVKIDCDVADRLNASQRLLVDQANMEDYISHIDSYVFTAFDREHPLFGSDADEQDSWALQWSREHSQVWLKGFAVLRLGETYVGLRVRS
jgi:hypothetical protein